MCITKFCGEKPRRGFTTCSVCRKNSVRKLERELGAEQKAARKELELNFGIEKIKKEHYEESKKLQEQNDAVKVRIERFPIATTIRNYRGVSCTDFDEEEEINKLCGGIARM